MPVGHSLIDRSVCSVEEKQSKSIPAVIEVTPEGSLRIASLTVLDRVLVAIHRAGAGPITVISESPLPPVKRTRALGIHFDTRADLPAMDDAVLFAKTNLLVQAADVRLCLETRSRLLSPDGTPLSIGLIKLPESSVEHALDDAPVVRAAGVARKVSDSASAAAAESALWSSLTSSSDGIVDKVFNRPCGRPLSKLLVWTPVTPNVISVTSIIIGVISAVFFAFGAYQSMVIGALLLQLSAIIDCVDGDVARVVFKETAIGKWIDLAGDQIVHIGVFAGIALGVARSSGTPALLWLGVSAVIGALISFGVVLRGMRSPSAESSGLKRLIDAATNRDFSVLVLGLALFDLTKVFLWLVAIGSHVFWILALSVQRRCSPSVEGASSKPFAK